MKAIGKHPLKYTAFPGSFNTPGYLFTFILFPFSIRSNTSLTRYGSSKRGLRAECSKVKNAFPGA
ncbi:hypothetical protein [Lentimicrobium sp.]|uniref:hypothetical protein n=1 Tax=Lentimicrobium sp. TaxID=2034841 RepID=UPI002B1F01AF|nr:hypothetical protein [Lentimicrobium sp.]